MTTSDADQDVAQNLAESGDGLLSRIRSGSVILDRSRAVSARVASAIRASWLYQWLTAEPDPEVIVIDLRDTWTVGPFLQVLDWIVDRLVDGAAGSRIVTVAQQSVSATRAAPLRVVGLVIAFLGLAVASSSLLGDVATTRLGVGVGIAVVGLIAMQDDRNWATLRETRPVALTIALLEPPEPLERSSGEETTAHSRTTQQRTQERRQTDADASGPMSEDSDAGKPSDSDDAPERTR